MTEIQPFYRKKCGLIVVTNYSKDFVDDPASGAPKLHYLLTQPTLFGSSTSTTLISFPTTLGTLEPEGAHPAESSATPGVSY